ncbi:Alpha/Beta hydrolase protein [Cubamyces lactineus]|nr:Alpha/Beta hydrolase protein [Cubamyces lactineus]
MNAELAHSPADAETSGSTELVSTGGVAESRALFDKFVTKPYVAFHESILPAKGTYDVQDHLVAVEGGEISVRCLVPVVEDANETFPVLVFMHGGGMCLGSIELDDYALRGWCVKHKISIVNVDYRLAPEHPFPTAVNDCHTALKWVVSNTPLLKGDLSKGFIVGGHSAGAYLCAVLVHIARDDPFFEGRRLTGQLLREPTVCRYQAYPESLKHKFRSIEENKDVPPVTKGQLDRLRAWYNGPPTDPRCSPLLYPSHEGLPRAYIQASQLDVLRDDGLVYAEVLKEAGVEVKVELYPDVGHGWYYNDPTSAASARAREGVDEALEWLLGRRQS